MNRVLLVDDSPHAQRIGERILSEEGYEVVTVSNADSAFVRLEDADPDVVIADTVMPGRTGYEICQYIKLNPRFQHVRVILTAGVLEPIDESQAAKVQADGTLKKPFEATMLLAAVKPMAESAVIDRERLRTGSSPVTRSATPIAAAPFVAVVEAEQVRAAVTIALDASMETMVEEITRRVMAALLAKPDIKAEIKPEVKVEAKAEVKIEAKPEIKTETKAEPKPIAPAIAIPTPSQVPVGAKAAPAAIQPVKIAPPAWPAPAAVLTGPATAQPSPATVQPAPAAALPAAAAAESAPAAQWAPAAAQPAPPPPSLKPALPSPAPMKSEPVRRVHPLRSRATSILGLEPLPSDYETPPPDPES